MSHYDNPLLDTPTLKPAYGRDYKTVNDAQLAFRAGKDWIIAATGQYCSIRDFKPGQVVYLRYHGLKAKSSFTLPGEAE